MLGLSPPSCSGLPGCLIFSRIFSRSPQHAAVWISGWGLGWSLGRELGTLRAALSWGSPSVHAREEEAASGGPGEHPSAAPGGEGLGAAPPGGPEEGRGRAR